MAKNLPSCCLLYLSVTLIVMNIGFIDAGSQNKQSTDDATKEKLDWLEEELNRLKNKETTTRKEDNISFKKVVGWVSTGYSAASLICYFEFLDGLPIVSGTKAFVCPYLAKKSSD